MCSSHLPNVKAMPRSKAKDQGGLLSHPIIIRVTAAEFKRLDDLRKDRDVKTIGDIVRKILSNQKVKIFHQDVSMSKPMEEMALVRKELRSIGININQITRSFNQDHSEVKRAFYSLKAAEQYTKVGAKVEELLVMISKFAEQWLQK